MCCCVVVCVVSDVVLMVSCALQSKEYSVNYSQFIPFHTVYYNQIYENIIMNKIKDPNPPNSHPPCGVFPPQYEGYEIIQNKTKYK